MPVVKIGDIKAGMQHLDLIAKVISKEITPRSADKPHASAVLQDDTGSIVLSLWRDQVEQVNVGDMISLQDAFVYVYKGNPELNTWKPIQIIKRASLR